MKQRTIEHQPAEAARHLGVLLMTYGSPATLDDVPAYLASVRGGRPVSPDVIAEFQRRYRIIGGSPLLERTRAQAAALEALLRIADPVARVGVGMRHAPPFIADGVRELVAAGARRLVGIIMSPQYSPALMDGYIRAFETAIADVDPGLPATVAGPWYDNPFFIQALADRIREQLEPLPVDERRRVMVFLTAHSMPKAVVDREPGYVQQLKMTARAVAETAGLQQWQFAYQSAGHTHEEWLKPDLKDLMPGLAAQGYRRVLVAPIQFLADHLEILYDIDVAARAEAEACGLAFSRIESLNTSPLFIQALADVVRASVAACV